MKALVIAAKDLRQFSRDRIGLMMNIAMPLLLILVLGLCLQGMVNSGYPTMSEFAVGVVDEDGGLLPEAFRTALSDNGLGDLLTPVDMTRTEASALIRDNKLAGAVIFPAGYSATIMAGHPAQLTVLLDPGSSIRGPVIKSLAQTFADRVLAVQIALVQAEAEPARAALLGQQVASRLAALAPKIREELSERGAQLTAMQYYAIGMTVMFLGFAGLSGLQSIIQERDLQTLDRVLAAPGSRLEFVAGKFLGVLSIAACQFALLLLGTHFVYGVSWGNSLPGVLLLGFAYAFAVSGLATLVSAFNRNPRGALSVWVLVVQVSSALGGNMVPLSVFPEGLRRVATWLPNHWALNGFFNLAAGEPLSAALPALGSLLALGAICLAIGALRLARE